MKNSTRPQNLVERWLFLKKKLHSPVGKKKIPPSAVKTDVPCSPWKSNGVPLKTYHNTKPKPSGCLGCKETAGPWCFLMGPLGPHPVIFLAFICLRICGWSSPITHQTRAQWLSWLLRKKRPFKVAYCLWGPYPLAKGTHLPLILCEWSSPFTTPNQSTVAVLVAKKKVCPLHILIWAPGAHILQHMGIFTIVGA